MKELIGKRILKIEIDKEIQHYLKFTIDFGEELLYRAYGDCCSESWFYGINGVLALLGFVVYTVEEVKMGEVKGFIGRQECTQAYCIKLTSTGGHTDIEFRNSSNGCYGGSVDFLGELKTIFDDKSKYSLDQRRKLKKIVWQEVKGDVTY